MKTHELKTWPIFFEAVAEGRKTFEIRKNDRHFREGDTVRLREYDPERDEYSGRALVFVVGYVTAWMQQPGYVVLALANALLSEPLAKATKKDGPSGQRDGHSASL